MSRIAGRHTRPERLLRSELWRSGLRYRLHYQIVGVRPDIVFVGPRVAVFVDGCFWHGCPDHYVRPRSNTEFWSQKLRTNVERDARQTTELEACGWRVCRLWEHEVVQDPCAAAAEVERALGSEPWMPRQQWRVVSVVPSDGDDTETWLLLDLRHRELERVETHKRSLGAR